MRPRRMRRRTLGGYGRLHRPGLVHPSKTSDIYVRHLNVTYCGCGCACGARNLSSSRSFFTTEANRSKTHRRGIVSGITNAIHWNSYNPANAPRRHWSRSMCKATKSMPNSDAPLLRGLTFIELAGVLAGPSVGQFFAELGCEVVKVENPRIGGDVTRNWRLRDAKDTEPSSYFQSCNLGKSSLSIDLRDDDDRKVLLGLIQSADIVSCSYKPGDAEKLGVDFPTLSSLNPKLIYAEITGYGKDDHRPGYDACIQAEAGFTYMNGEPEGPPIKMPVALVDVLAAHHLKEAVLLALLEREKTGRGKHVSVSLLRAAAISTANQAAGWLHAGAIPERIGSSHPAICPYGTVFLDKNDKPFVLAVGTDAQFKSLCDIVDLDVVFEDFVTNPQRVERRNELIAALRKSFARADRDQLLLSFAEKAIPAGAVKDMKEVFEHPEVQKCLIRGKYVSQIGWDEPRRVREEDIMDPPSRVGQDDIRLKKDVS